MDFELIAEAFPKLIGGIDETLILAGSSLIIGFILAVPIALMNLSRHAILRSIATGYVYIFRSTPLLVQIFLIYYGSGQFEMLLRPLDFGFVPRSGSARYCIHARTAAYTSQIIRGGLQSVPAEQSRPLEPLECLHS